ncbi:MAG TPA: hypothetical protein VIP11_18945 [Gemmatimonadaceae bacterium]
MVTRGENSRRPDRADAIISLIIQRLSKVDEAGTNAGGNVVLPSSQGAAGVLASLAASCAGLVLADSGRAGICWTTRADTAFGPITSAEPSLAVI